MNAELSFNPIVMIDANNMTANETMKWHKEFHTFVC